MTWDPMVEFYDGSTWQDISSYVRKDVGVKVVTGLRDEGSTTDTAMCAFRLDNSDGRFSPRNPAGAYYGKIMRGTRVRYSQAAPRNHLLTTDGSVDTATTPDSASLSITGDLEMQFSGWLPSWRTDTDLMGKWVVSGNQASYVFHLNAEGTVRMGWSNTGNTATSYISATSTEVLPFKVGDGAVKVTFDADNGAGGRDYTFYWSTDDGSTWTQLGDVVVGGTPTTIYDSTAELIVGDTEGQARMNGRIYWAKVLSGIGGSEVANPDFTGESGGTTSFADSAGNTWTVNGGAEISARDYRFHGEIPNWPPRWDRSGNNRWADIVAADPQRRIARPTTASTSLYRKSVTAPTSAITGLVAYWPLEDPDGSTQFASGYQNGYPMGIQGSPSLAADSSFVASDPLPTFDDGSAAAGAIGTYADGTFQVLVMLKIPSGGLSAKTRFLSVLTSGGTYRYELSIDTSGNFYYDAYDQSGASVLASGAISLGTANGQDLRIQMYADQNGSDIDWRMTALPVGASSGTTYSGTISSQTVGHARWVAIAPDFAMGGSVVGHLTVQSEITSVYSNADQLAAYVGETAGARFNRVCGEIGLGKRVLGGETRTSTLGPQGSGKTLDALDEAVAADGGVRLGSPNRYGFDYRTRYSMQGCLPVLTLDYSSGQVYELQPVEDDRYVTNDYTLSRVNGSSRRITQETGPLSTQDPPDGAGVYDDSGTQNVYEDAQLGDHCSWIVHRGTVDEARYPVIGVHMDAPDMTATLRDAAQLTGIGDEIVVQNLPSNEAVDDIRQIAVGRAELCNETEWIIEFVCQPASPFDVGRLDDPYTNSKLTTEGSTLNGTHNSTTTSWSVATPVGQLWTHADGDYDWIVDGERVTVTATSGSSSPQTVTVTRSVNGVVSSHADGAEIKLFRRTYLGIGD